MKQKFTMAQKREMAVSLMLAGLSLKQIGEQIGVSKTRAHQLVQEAFSEYELRTQQTIDNLRTRQLMRINILMQAIWTKAKGGALEHIDRWEKLARQEAAIGGFKAPDKIANTDSKGRDLPRPEDDYDNMTVEELENRIKELEAKTIGRHDGPTTH